MWWPTLLRSDRFSRKFDVAHPWFMHFLIPRAHLSDWCGALCRTRTKNSLPETGLSQLVRLEFVLAPRPPKRGVCLRAGLRKNFLMMESYYKSSPSGTPIDRLKDIDSCVEANFSSRKINRRNMDGEISLFMGRTEKIPWQIRGVKTRGLLPPAMGFLPMQFDGDNDPLPIALLMATLWNGLLVHIFLTQRRWLFLLLIIILLVE